MAGGRGFWCLCQLISGSPRPRYKPTCSAKLSGERADAWQSVLPVRQAAVLDLVLDIELLPAVANIGKNLHWQCWPVCKP